MSIQGNIVKNKKQQDEEKQHYKTGDCHKKGHHC